MQNEQCSWTLPWQRAAAKPALIVVGAEWAAGIIAGCSCAGCPDLTVPSVTLLSCQCRQLQPWSPGCALGCALSTQFGVFTALTWSCQTVPVEFCFLQQVLSALHAQPSLLGVWAQFGRFPLLAVFAERWMQLWCHGSKIWSFYWFSSLSRRFRSPEFDLGDSLCIQGFGHDNKARESFWQEN